MGWMADCERPKAAETEAREQARGIVSMFRRVIGEARDMAERRTSREATAEYAGRGAEAESAEASGFAAGARFAAGFLAARMAETEARADTKARNIGSGFVRDSRFCLDYGNASDSHGESGFHWATFPAWVSDARILAALWNPAGWECHSGDWDCCGRSFGESVYIKRGARVAVAVQGWAIDC